MTPLRVPPPPAPPPPEALRERVRASIEQTRPSGMSMRARTATSLVVVLALIAGGLAVIRPDLAQLPRVPLLAVTAGVGALGLSTLLVALSPGRRGLGASVTLLVVLATLTAPLYAVVTLLAALGTSPNIPAVPGCFSMSLGFAAVALAGLTWALRRSVPAAPIARGALLGANAGAWAGLIIHLHCPCGDRLHILVGHAVPIAIFAVVGAVLTPRFLRP